MVVFELILCHFVMFWQQIADLVGMVTPEIENKDLHRVLDEAISLARIFDISDPKMLDIGLLARIHRAKRNLTIDAAAKAIGITRHLLSEIEDGKIPQKAKITLMCNFYGPGFEIGIKLLAL